MCSPLEPDVFGNPGTPSLASSSRTHRATSSTFANVAASVGSRSMATWSASSGDCTRENHGSCEIAAICVM